MIKFKKNYHRKKFNKKEKKSFFFKTKITKYIFINKKKLNKN